MAFDGFWWLLYLGLCMAMCVLLPTHLLISLPGVAYWATAGTANS